MASEELNGLAKELQNGNINAFDDVYHLTKDIVYYTILSIMKDPNISEDLMQETYLKVLEKIHSYRRKGSFKSWIITIARNLSYNEFNKRKRELSYDPTENEYVFGSVESTSEKELIVQELLEKLDDVEREIVILHVIGDLKHREIAKILDMPLGTVTWKYNQSIKKLQSQMESR